MAKNVNEDCITQIEVKFEERKHVMSAVDMLKSKLKGKDIDIQKHVSSRPKDHLLIVKGLKDEFYEVLEDFSDTDYKRPQKKLVKMDVSRPETPKKSQAESMRKMIQSIEEGYEGFISDIECKLEDKTQEVSELYEVWGKEVEKVEGLERHLSNVNEELEESKDRNHCGAPLEDSRKLVKALREDYQKLQNLGLESAPNLDQDSVRNPEKLSDLLDVESKEEYFKKVLGRSIQYSPEELENLPEGFEDTGESKKYDDERLRVAGERLNFVQRTSEANVPVPEEMLSHEEAEKDTQLINEYHLARTEFKNKKQAKQDLESIEGTYETIKEVQDRVNYREDKKHTISYVMTDQMNEEGDLSVKLMVPLEQGQNDSISQDITTHARKGLGISEDTLSGHTRYSDDNCRVFTRNVSINNDGMYQITGNIKQHLDDNVDKYLFSSLGVGIEIIHRSKI